MKKTMLLLIAVLMTSVFYSATGQKRSYMNTKYYKRSLPKFSFGPKAGVNYATQSCPNIDDYDVHRIPGINLGGYFNYFFTHQFAVQPELLYSVKGSRWRDAYDHMKDVLTYIEIPVLVSYHPVRTFNIHAGPQFGHLISARQKDLETGEISNLRSFYEEYDIGITFGAEAVFPFRLNISLRYFHGLLTVTNDYGYVDPWKNNYFQVSAGYRFSVR